MNTPDLERRLTTELHRRAEDAMNQTRTEEKLHDLLAGAEGQARRHRAGWTAGILVAAAALVAAAMVLPGLRGADRVPEGASAPDSPTPTQVATGFIEAYASFDRPEAASYLSGSAASVNDWQADNRWFEAVGFQLHLGPCDETATSGPGVWVDCSFSYDSMHSEELGKGPFGGSVFTVLVDSGEVLDFDLQLEFESSGFSTQVWEPFAAWVSRAHPQDAAVMYDDWPSQSQQALTPDALRLWRVRTQEYADRG